MGTECPLLALDYDSFFKSAEPMGLHHVKEIEDHVSNGSCPHPPLEDFVFKGNGVNGTTPLLLACFYGELDSVKHIVESWGADVRTSALCYTYPPDGCPGEECISGEATPLFVSALNGHTDIVRYLLGKGANVSDKSAYRKYKGLSLTPLHGAVLRNNIRIKRSNRVPDSEMWKESSAIVRILLEAGADPSALPTNGSPIWAMPLCGFEAITHLINNGMDLQQRGHGGSTVLHYWAGKPVQINEEGRKEDSTLIIVKLLVEKGAHLTALDDKGFTPTLAAADTGLWFHPDMSILDYLLERDEISCAEKVEALEVAGAVILRDPSNSSFYSKGKEYWRQALRLRLINGRINKTPFKLISGRTLEWVTPAQLEEAIQKTDEYPIQSFLLLLRIFSTKTWRATSALLNKGLLWGIHRKLSPQHRFTELVDLWWILLETMSHFHEQEQGLDFSKATAEVVEKLVWALTRVERGNSLLHTKSTIKTLLELLIATDPIHMGMTEYFICFGSYDYDENHMRVLLQLVDLLSEMPVFQTDKDLKDCLFEFLRRERHTERGKTILHVACANTYRDIIRLLPTIRLLLQAGIDPNAGDVNGNGPLHVVAELLSSELLDPVVHLLLEFGAHLDRVNKVGKTAMDVWAHWRSGRKRRFDSDQVSAGWLEDRPEWCRTFPKLICLTARVIRLNKVPNQTKLPQSLQRFVEMH